MNLLFQIPPVYEKSRGKDDGPVTGLSLSRLGYKQVVTKTKNKIIYHQLGWGDFYFLKNLLKLYSNYILKIIAVYSLHKTILEIIKLPPLVILVFKINFPSLLSSRMT